jgi:hypothetical protein
MHRLTARALLVLLLLGVFVPVALAVSAAPPHACCMRKPMHGRPSHDSEFHAPPGCCQHDCCRTLTVSQWANLSPQTNIERTPASAPLEAELQEFHFKPPINHAYSGRAPPQISIA